MIWRPIAVRIIMLCLLFLVVRVSTEELGIAGNSSANNSDSGNSTQGWGEWDEWSACSLLPDNESCEQSRERVCQLTPCEGEGNQTQLCSQCDIPPSWSLWGEWTECSYKTSMCYKTKNRTCEYPGRVSNMTCEGQAETTEECDIAECKNVAQWGLWSPFTDCKFYASTKECKRTRVRACEEAKEESTESVCQPPGTTEQSFNQSCQDKECGADVEYWSAWSAWSQCGPRETDCLRSHSRDCIKPSSPTTISLCEGNNVTETDCDRSSCRPSFDPSDVAQTKKVDYGDRFRLQCKIAPSNNKYIAFDLNKPRKAISLGLILITWKRNGEIIDLSKKEETMVDPLRMNIEYMTNYHEGIYVCCAESFFGEECSQDIMVRLNNNGPVVAPNDALQLEELAKEGAMTLFCDVKGYELTYQWYFKSDGEGSSIVPLEGAKLKHAEITDFNRMKSGRYWCCSTGSTHSTDVKQACLKGYDVTMASNERTKYLIAICVLGSVIIFILAILLFCYHSNKMNGFKRRFNHVFNRNHGKVYNNSIMYSINDQPVQRSHSYIKRLSRSRPLSGAQLEELLAQLTESGGEYLDSPELNAEYESVPTNMITITKTPVGTESRNRYLNVLPNPHTRVEIAELEGDPTTTYINANYIRGYKLAPAVYIATQGPIHSTTGDFWRLVWEQRQRVIVMTTGIMENSRIKCSPYWPTTDDDEDFTVGNFTVELKGMYPSKYFTLSILAVTSETEDDEETRMIYHFWYHSWPDFGVPEDTGPFLDFVEYVRLFTNQVESNDQSKLSTLIHCSAGIGRTGTFVAVNLGIEQFNDEGVVDPLGYLCQLRQDRGGMIQTLDQYTFIHRALHAYQARSKESKESEEYSVEHGLPSLAKDDPLLPEGCVIPTVLNPDSCTVDDEFMRRVTRTIPAPSSHHDSITSINNPALSVENLPLIKPSPASSKESLKKSKRSSKVKSLFFPLSPKPKLGSGSSESVELSRSLSLSDVKFTKVNCEDTES